MKLLAVVQFEGGTEEWKGGMEEGREERAGERYETDALTGCSWTMEWTVVHG